MVVWCAFKEMFARYKSYVNVTCLQQQALYYYNKKKNLIFVKVARYRAFSQKAQFL